VAAAAVEADPLAATRRRALTALGLGTTTVEIRSGCGLAVIQMGLLALEALTGVTFNAAYALGMAERAGSLDPGKQADFLLLDGESPAIPACHAGVSPLRAVYKRGEPVAGKEQP
jgi:imidazolonepropionase-like amidohydrolase